ncbi:DUF3348 domain-containing protein [Paucibacter sp. B2R-40]|uniref:DUF3348 domain-containing protein n=1 Tax=Paucibacter sp. B2R-40 TaxID=2893554 RepID=UPI0021E42FEA|nr:DUF3348 domain-containing protein [Paucibacter sp. B2R-40]MCV2355699.1 DUF3348 domain-containing protein [Paucibacter sp. B2R-40]
MQPISKPVPPFSPVPSFPPESLSRLLRQWCVAPGSPPPAAERLGSWFCWADAIEISQVLTTSPGRANSERPQADDLRRPPSEEGGQGRSGPSLSCEAARIESMCWANAELARIQAQLAASFNHTELACESDSMSDGAALKELLVPYLQHFAQQQRLIESRTAAFRTRLRACLTRDCDELARLAQLDDYIERAMAPPQLRAMTGLSALLETRASKHYAADPRQWRARLWSDLQRLLRAELDQKLQPVLGLIEALNTNSPP